MAIVYASHDIKLCESIEFIIRADTEFVNHAATMAELGTYLGRKWLFQFPPRIKTDSKSAEWNEVRRVSYEPIAMWRGADARTLSLEATYVVTGEKNFSGIEISRIASAAKAYFYRSIEGAYENKHFGPVVEITTLYGAVREQSTWRMTDVSVEYADTFVNDETVAKKSANTKFNVAASAIGLSSYTGRSVGGPDISKMWPLWTKITFNLKSFTRNAAEDGKEKLAVAALVPSPTAKWF